jgi:hypothetical protein
MSRDELIARAKERTEPPPTPEEWGYRTALAPGEHILGLGERSSGLRRALEAAGFIATPRGLRIRA